MERLNDLMHEAINKFNTINIMCGALALELESDRILGKDQTTLKNRLTELLGNMERDLSSSNQLLAEIIAITTKELDCYKDTEHFFKMIRPLLATIKEKKLQLVNIINENEKIESTNNIIAVLHTIEEKALASAITLKELRSALAKVNENNAKRT